VVLESSEQLIHDDGIAMEDGSHQQPRGAKVQEVLSVIGAADASAHLDAYLVSGLQDVPDQGAHKFAVASLAPCGVHIHQSEAAAALIQEPIHDLQGQPIRHVTARKCRYDATALDVESGQNLQAGAFPV
jgi:hypothetical protein